MAWVWPGLKELSGSNRALEILDRALERLQAALTRPEPPVQLAYSSTITPDAARAVRRVFKLSVTNGSAFTINGALQGQEGALISFDVLNASGGAMGAVTWGTDYKLAGAWVNPANGKRRTITFYKTGPALTAPWVELSRAAADI